MQDMSISLDRGPGDAEGDRNRQQGHALEQVDDEIAQERLIQNMRFLKLGEGGGTDRQHRLAAADAPRARKPG